MPISFSRTFRLICVILMTVTTGCAPVLAGVGDLDAVIRIRYLKKSLNFGKKSDIIDIVKENLKGAMR